jgi:hypothetical protein
MSTKIVIACAASALAGIAFVLSCSDDAPGSADAAVCDCPAAEAPLEGRVVDVVGPAQDLPANTFTAVTLSCPAGAITLSGGCSLSGFIGVPDASLIASVKSGGGPQEWECAWANRSPDILQGTVTVTCLMPVP